MSMQGATGTLAGDATITQELEALDEMAEEAKERSVAEKSSSSTSAPVAAAGTAAASGEPE